MIATTLPCLEQVQVWREFAQRKQTARGNREGVRLIFCELRPSFLLSRRKSHFKWTNSRLFVNLNLGWLPHACNAVKSTSRRFYVHMGHIQVFTLGRSDLRDSLA